MKFIGEPRIINAFRGDEISVSVEQQDFELVGCGPNTRPLGEISPTVLHGTLNTRHLFADMESVKWRFTMKDCYHIPAGFNPYSTIDAIRGLTDAIHHLLLEGPGTAAHMEYGDRAGLNALVELLQTEVHVLHDYLSEIDNRGSLELPTSDEELDALDAKYTDGVREEPALYLVQ